MLGVACFDGAGLRNEFDRPNPVVDGLPIALGWRRDRAVPVGSAFLPCADWVAAVCNADLSRGLPVTGCFVLLLLFSALGAVVGACWELCLA
jgi:hypothetical protein